MDHCSEKARHGPQGFVLHPPSCSPPCVMAWQLADEPRRAALHGVVQAGRGSQPFHGGARWMMDDDVAAEDTSVFTS